MHPLRGDWVMRLEEMVQAQAEEVVLVAHSMGCHLVAAWAAQTRLSHRVRGALLVAPGDPQQPELAAVLHSWTPLVLPHLPFPSRLLGSRNDPYCSLARAQIFADALGAQWMDCGEAGHINADSGLGDWPQGRALLNDFLNTQP
jgi:predicted alpha/beta hydrolase family esterase